MHVERISSVSFSNTDSEGVKLLATDELGAFGDCDVVGFDKTFDTDCVILWKKLTMEIDASVSAG